VGSLKPFEPSRTRPWDRTAAQHLLRRAGFAPSAEEVRQALDEGPRECVERLVASSSDSPRHDELDETGKAIALRNDIGMLRGWWLLRLVHTRRPLHARMALFWHNHFATSNAKIRSSALMLQQLRVFETHALGRFEALLQAVSRDPAMIVWLDGNENTKGRPNENYARELFELFSLGVGHYSERDIKQSARAFTGWHTRTGAFYFAKLDHDEGEKTVLGVSGDLDGDDVVRAALRQPACPRFLARKLLREFLCPSPPDELIDEWAVVLRESAYDLAASMRTLLASEAMFDPCCYRARIKSPVEFAIGVVRSLRLEGISAAALADATAQSGQRLFEPPSVKGWDGHRAWLNSATMLVRLNSATRAVDVGLKPAVFRDQQDLRDPERIARFCEDLILDGNVPQSLRAAYPADSSDLDRYLRAVLRSLLTCPEYQMA
jgi:uncharacterized protein (DUF1800 family)